MGELLELPFVHASHPVPALLRRWADPGVVENIGVAQGVHVRAILVDPGAQLIGTADGPVAGDDDIDIACHALEQPQSVEVVLDRIGGLQVEHRDQDIGEHVARDENPAFLDEQSCVTGGMRLMLEDPDRRAIPGDQRRFSGQAGDQAVQVERDLPGDFGLGKVLGDVGLRIRSDSSSRTVAAHRAVP